MYEIVWWPECIIYGKEKCGEGTVREGGLIIHGEWKVTEINYYTFSESVMKYQWGGKMEKHV